MATHGSLTKAGKVRGQTPKVEGRKIKEHEKVIETVKAKYW
jgi:ribosomal protein S30